MENGMVVLCDEAARGKDFGKRADGRYAEKSQDSFLCQEKFFA